MNEERSRLRVDLLLGIVCFLVALSAVVFTLGDPGLAWDEPAYLGAGANILAHLSARLSSAPSDVPDPWDRASAHPVFGKLLVAAALAAFEPVFGDYLLAGRMVGALSYAGIALLLFVCLSRRSGRTAGAWAAALWIAHPRIFGHAHFAALDMMLAFFFLATAVAFVFERGSRLAGLFSGILWGLALGVKVNAIILPVFLIPLAFLSDGRRAWRQVLPFVVVGVGVFLLLFLPMWLDGPRQILQYLTGGALRAVEGIGPVRTEVPVFYMGRVFRGNAPWHYYPVMLLAVSPVIFVVLAAGGAVRAVRRRRNELALLFVCAAAVALGAALAGPFPKYDGVRLILYAFPFLAGLAGIGGEAAVALLRRRGSRAVASAAVVAALAAQIVVFHPYELSYYSAAVGWLRGAHRLGFEITYWLETNDAKLFGFLNRQTPPGAKVAFYPVEAAAVRFFYEPGFLRDDIEVVEIGATDTVADLRARGVAVVVIANRRSFLAGTALASSLEGLSPIFYNTVPVLGDVPLSAVYRID
ncbi:MAG: glycosyltransferase 87 family protein [Planctomycetota bacterium]